MCQPANVYHRSLELCGTRSLITTFKEIMANRRRHRVLRILFLTFVLSNVFIVLGMYFHVFESFSYSKIKTRDGKESSVTERQRHHHRRKHNHGFNTDTGNHVQTQVYNALENNSNYLQTSKLMLYSTQKYTENYERKQINAFTVRALVSGDSGSGSQKNNSIYNNDRILHPTNASESGDERRRSETESENTTEAEQWDKRPNNTQGNAITFPNITDPETLFLLQQYEERFDDKYVRPHNKFGVPPVNDGRTPVDENVESKRLLCKLKSGAPIQPLTPDTTPFKEIGIGKYFPQIKFSEAYKQPFEKCAVVGTARFLREFKHGTEIDDHDAVLRMNAAPVKGYESIVGNKTTFHLFNSQFLEKRSFKTIKETYPGNVTHIVWKGGPYSGNMYRWYNTPIVKKFLSGYIEWQSYYPTSTMYVVNPKSNWDAWDIMKDYCKSTSHNPLSTGVTGIQVMLHICKEVDVYGMLYPTTSTSLCHYYRDIYSCSKLKWHPLSMEKCFIGKLVDNNVTSAYENGKFTLQGFPSLDCDF